MKRIPGIALMCIVTVGLLTSGRIGSESYNGDDGFTLPEVTDTTGLTGFIKVAPFRLDILPPSSGVQFYGNGILFLSNTKFESKMLPKHVSFGSTEAYAGMISDTAITGHSIFSPTASFSFPCEATTFSADYQTMYYTKIPKKENKEKIFRAQYKPDRNGEDGWVSDEQPLEFCKGNYLFTHPALSADGKTLVFASDMQGTLGGLDLFTVTLEGDKWSVPRNLGAAINTIRFECYPFIDRNNNLYYSSDGLAGYGGNDIFTCKFNGETWEKPVNLSRKINTVNDDIAFTIDRQDGRTAFFTIRKKSNGNDLQLRRITLSQEKIDNTPLTIAYIFNGKPGQKPELVAEKPAEPAKAAPAVVKQEPKAEEKKAADQPAAPTQQAKVVIIKNTSELPEELKNKVIYRIQFMSTGKQRMEKKIVINGVSYKTYEYFYLNLYRYTIGEYTSLQQAKDLQVVVRKAGYPDAFVAAFKNDMRSLDLTLFK
jgi:hypothetical protein